MIVHCFQGEARKIDQIFKHPLLCNFLIFALLRDSNLFHRNLWAKNAANLVEDNIWVENFLLEVEDSVFELSKV